MKRLFSLICLCIDIVIVASCQKSPMLELQGSTYLSFSSDGGTETVIFTTNRPWSITSEPWCEVSPSSGTASGGPVSITVSCEANRTFASRTCALRIKAEELTKDIQVRQEKNYGVLVSPTSFDLTNEAQIIEVEVQANIYYDIEIDASCQNWITQDKTKAPLSEKIVYNIAANESYDAREGKISIKTFSGEESETIIIRQSQASGLFVSPASFDVGNGGDTISLTVTTNESFNYVIAEDAKQWIIPVSSKGLSSSTLLFDVLKNEGGKLRVGTITIIGANNTRTVNVIQSDEKPTLVLGRKLIGIEKEGGTFDVEVKSNMAVYVSIPYNCNWIKEVSSKAITSSIFSFEVEENSNSLRRETELLFTCEDPFIEENITVIQEPSYPYPFISTEKKQFEFDAEGGDFSIDVSSNTEYQVQISDMSWIKLVDTKSVANSTYSFHVAKNDADSWRGAEIRFIQEGGTLTETVKVMQYSSSNPSPNWNNVVSYRGGFTRYIIHGNNPDDYEVIIKDSWITLAESYCEDGWCVFVFSVAPNANATQPRTGEIRFYYQGNSKPDYFFPTQYEKMPSVLYTVNSIRTVAPIVNNGIGSPSGIIDWGDGYQEEYQPTLIHSYSDGGVHNVILEIRKMERVSVPFTIDMKVDFSAL